MKVLLEDVLVEKGITEDTVKHMYKALGKRVYADEISISSEEYYELAREAYNAEYSKGRLVELWNHVEEDSE
jgi:nitrate reductase beta subunit